MLLVGILVFSCSIGAYYEHSQEDYIRISEPYSVEPVKANDPCEPFEPTTLNYSFPSLRISEKKCFEYIDQVENHIRKEKWTERCDHNIQIKRDDKETLETTLIIFGGQQAEAAEFPHMGAVGWKAKDPSVKWVFKCGSTLISEKFLLTAAHCSKLPLRSISDVIQRQPEIVRLGDTNISNDEIRVKRRFIDMKIKRIILYPKYASPEKYYDIALIELYEQVKFSNSLHPACLWSKHQFNKLGHEVMLTRWGYTEHGHLPEVLQVATVPVLETPLCEELLKPYRNRNWHGFQNHQICAGKLTGGVDTCQGDSGGPIQIKMNLKWNEGKTYWILGVTSFGIKCGHMNRPGIYTRVSSFIEWIEEIIWDPME